MSNLQSIRKFEYRLSRTNAGFNVDFIAEGETFHGLCKDISDAGIRAEFDGPMVVGSSGLLILRLSARTLKLEAKVAYVRNRQAGLVFACETPLELDAAVEFIAAIARRPATHS
jgi:hypothetical protein